MPVCDGLEPQYVERFGDGELIPYINENRGNVLDRARLDYRPAYYVKLKPEADIKKAIAREFVPEPLPDNPKVSVIVTCYNYGQYLRECLESVKAQTYKNIEVIIADDASTDDSWAIAAEFIINNSTPDNNWQATRSSVNAGQPAIPRNKGILQSKGDLILCLDADDKLQPTMIEECVRKMQENPRASIIYTGVTVFGEDNKQWSAPPSDYGHLLQQNYICYASLYRRQVWLDVKGYSTNVRGMEDYEFWVKAHGLGYQSMPLPRQLWMHRWKKDGVFQSDVLPNFEAKYRQLVLNNEKLYPQPMVKAAKAGFDVPRGVG
jgi:glycosyltransferase involved in cell wall biosynthesis